ncbi:hypothetical protein AO263_22650, partial [Pseudomonas sp. NZIPFR-PS5]
MSFSPAARTFNPSPAVMPSSTPRPLSADTGRQSIGSDKRNRTVQRQPRYTCSSTRRSLCKPPPCSHSRASSWSAVNSVSNSSL